MQAQATEQGASGPESDGNQQGGMEVELALEDVQGPVAGPSSSYSTTSQSLFHSHAPILSVLPVLRLDKSDSIAQMSSKTAFRTHRTRCLSMSA